MVIRYILIALFLSLFSAANAQQLSPADQVGRQNFIQNNNPLNYLLNNPINQRPSTSYSNNPYNSDTGAANFNPNFWNSFFNKRTLDTGTVFNGILQEDISSNKSKAGDVFSILLTEGYVANNQTFIPPNSRIVGSVMSAVPAKQTKYGNPGSLQVSLQTLITPDNMTTIPISAYIDYNPNQSTDVDPKKSRGIPLTEWAKSTGNAVSLFAGGVGSKLGVPFFYNTQNRGGKDFVLKKGELLPIKLSQPLDLSKLASKNNSVPMTPNTVTSPSSFPGPNFNPGSQANPQINQPFPSPGNTNNMLPNNSLPAGPEPF